MGVTADTRQVIQELVAPDLKRMDEAPRGWKKALPEMGTRLLPAINLSEDRRSLRIDFARLRQKYRDLQRRYQETPETH